MKYLTELALTISIFFINLALYAYCFSHHKTLFTWAFFTLLFITGALVYYCIKEMSLHNEILKINLELQTKTMDSHSQSSYIHSDLKNSEENLEENFEDDFMVINNSSNHFRQMAQNIISKDKTPKANLENSGNEFKGDKSSSPEKYSIPLPLNRLSIFRVQKSLTFLNTQNMAQTIDGIIEQLGDAQQGPRLIVTQLPSQRSDALTDFIEKRSFEHQVLCQQVAPETDMIPHIGDLRPQMIKPLLKYFIEKANDYNEVVFYILKNDESFYQSFCSALNHHATKESYLFNHISNSQQSTETISI